MPSEYLQYTLSMCIAIAIASYLCIYCGSLLIGVGGITFSLLLILLILVQVVIPLHGDFNIKTYLWIAVPLLWMECFLFRYFYIIYSNLPYIQDNTMPQSWYTFTSILGIVLLIQIGCIGKLLYNLCYNKDYTTQIMWLYVIALVMTIYVGICYTIAFSFRTDG
jgi:hypothetical protein